MNKQPVRLFEGEGRPFEPFWKVVDEAEAESGEAEIQFYGPISEFSWWGDEVTPGLFKAELDKLGGKPVTVRIHSAGGDVFAASAIRAMIMDYPGKVTTRIDGMCASAATYVAMAGNVVRMQDSAFFMVHDPWTVVMGSADELKTAARILETVKKGIVETYQGKTGQDPAVLDRWMSKETWFTAQEAKEAGFVDEVISEPSKQWMMDKMAVANAIRDYENVPEELRRALTTKDTKDTKDFEIGKGRGIKRVTMSDEEREKLGMILLGDDGRWVDVKVSEVRKDEDVTVEAGTSETAEAEAEKAPPPTPPHLQERQMERGEDDPAYLQERQMERGENPTQVQERQMEKGEGWEREREVKSLRDYIRIFG
jgi:ATP-dependent Clp protease protease subunit